MTHLDSESWQRLGQREPQATAYFAEHLATPCDDCETFLSGAQGSGELEGAVDHAALPAGGTLPFDEVGFRRIQRRLGARRAASFAGGFAAVAAAVFAVVAVRAPSPSPAYDGIKGEAALGLSVSAAASSPDRPGVWERIDPGAKLLPAQAVVLRYSVTSDSVAVLLEDRGDVAAARILGRFSLRGGTHDLSLGGAPASVGLDSERGLYRLWLVARPGTSPLSDEDALGAVRGARGSADRTEVALFPLEVERGQGPEAR